MPVKEAHQPGLAAPAAAKTDRELVQGCLQNREEDWNLLVDKYKNLIYSIPLRYGLSRDDAADIFQCVCLDLLEELATLRDPQALPKWLMQVTVHKCFHRKKQSNLLVSEDQESAGPEKSVPPEVELLLGQVEEEQMLQEALAGLPPRCRKLIHMLFYEEPKRPYKQVAASIGLSTGSIGLLRQKCLDSLKKRLDELGFT